VLSWLGASLEVAPSVWAAAALAILVIALFVRAWVHYLAIPMLPGAPEGGTPPDCMVVIPARDEELYIADAVKAFPHDTVIVVDDQSQDGTAAAAEKAGAGVVIASPLARGAFGKSNACQTGARLLTSKWILFADADTRVKPGLLNAAIACAESNELAFLSIYLQPAPDSGRSALLMPLAAALYYCGIDPKEDPASVFNGQCVLVRRDAYEFAGGHGAVQTSLVEDVKLAGLAQRHRLKFASVRGDGFGFVYLRELWDTVDRGAFRFMVAASSSGLAILATAAVFTLWLPALVFLLLDGHFWIGAVYLILPVPLLWPWYRGFAGIAAPFAMYAVLPMLASGLYSALTGRKVVWKKRKT
jgi:chlorobactene glucosyltransferase